MSRGRLIPAIAVATVVVSTSAAMGGAPVSVNPSARQVSTGSVTIVRTIISDQEFDYSVAFDGPLNVHGWSHTGRLSGTSGAYLWEAFDQTIPNFDVSTDDGRVTGQCGGALRNTLDDATTLGTGLTPSHYEFDCVLSQDGGTPWQITIRTDTQESDTPSTVTFAGTYKVVDTASSYVGIDEDVTYGDAQLTEYTDDGGGVQWGPLRFSGQLMIGSTRYEGDLVSDVGPYVYAMPMPPMNMTGSANGLTVSGSCANTPDGPVTTVIGHAEWAFDFNCQLSINGGSPNTVLWRTTFTGGGGRCSGRQCWSDYKGYVTDQ